MPDERLSRLEELMAEMLIKYDQMNRTMEQMQAVMLGTLNANQSMLEELRAAREAYEQGSHQMREDFRILNDRVTDIQGYVQRIHQNTVNSNEDLRLRVVRLESRMDDFERKAS